MAATRSNFPNEPAWREQFEAELKGNILPFWMRHTVDRVHGGFYGAVTNDLQIRNDIPRSAILCARILWTYAAAYRIFGGEEYLSMARWAYDYLRQAFLDPKYGGVYWEVDQHGRPTADRKHHYAQAFAIYGLSEYYRATHTAHSLTLAQELYHLLEKHAYEPTYGGYTEGSSRSWGTLEDMRLSAKDLNCRKSMNTMLHMLEGYTNLLRIWEDSHLRSQHKALIHTFLDHILDPHTHHFKLFFDDRWNSLANIVSYGHDIEGSWLLWEAAEAQGDQALMRKVRQATILLAEAVYQEGLDTDGSLIEEGGAEGNPNANKEWWTQAEGVVGFYNAYQLTGQEGFAQAARRLWAYIQDKVVDRAHGDWFKRLRRDGTPVLEGYKAGPWECPYHHSRACFEMLRRLKKAKPESSTSSRPIGYL